MARLAPEVLEVIRDLHDAEPSPWLLIAPLPTAPYAEVVFANRAAQTWVSEPALFEALAPAAREVEATGDAPSLQVRVPRVEGGPVVLDAELGRFRGLVSVRLAAPHPLEQRLAFEHDCRVKLEDELASLAELLVQAPVSVALHHGPEHALEFVNPRFEALAGRRGAIGLPLAEGAPTLHGTDYARGLDQALREGRTVALEAVELPGDRTFRFIFQPMRRSDEVTGVVAFGFETTEHALAEKRAHALAQVVSRNEARFRSLVSATAQVVWVGDIDGNVSEDSPSWRAFTGQSLEEWLSPGGAFKAIHPDDRAACAAVWTKAFEEEKPFVGEYRLIRPDGSYTLTAVRAVPVRNDDGSVREWVGTNTDVTDAHKAQHALEFLDAASRALVTSQGSVTRRAVASIAVPVLGDACVLLADHADRARTLEALACGDDLREPFGWVDWSKAQPAELKPLGVTAWHVVPLRAYGRQLGELWLLRTAKGAEFSATEQELASRYADRASMALMNAQMNEEREVLLAKERHAREGAEHEVAQRTRELVAARERLLQRERMAAVGNLSAGVAHEINNPLAFILGNLEFIEDEVRAQLPNEEDLVTAIGECREGGRRIARIVKDLKTFSHADAEANLVMVDEVLAFSLSMAASTLKQRARVEQHIDPGLPGVVGSKTQLGQVFLNLLLNAAQAITPGSVEQNVISVRAHLNARDEVVVEVTDTGCGMSADVQAHLFEPFFTTKKQGEGTGLGLATCHGIVARMGGRLEVESQVGKGSTFRVVVPPAQAPNRSAPKRLRVLVVSKDSQAATLIAPALPDDGQVVVSATVEAALHTLRTDAAFDLVLTDGSTAGSGEDLLVALRREFPKLVGRCLIVGAENAKAAATWRGTTGALVLDQPLSAGALRSMLERLGMV